MKRALKAGLALTVAMTLWAVAPAAESIIADVQQVPVDRLTRNLEALVAKDPTNVSLRVNLARAHAMAYALKVSQLPVSKDLPNKGAHTRDKS